jgi:hypothetical protein
MNDTEGCSMMAGLNAVKDISGELKKPLTGALTIYTATLEAQVPQSCL